MTIYAFWCPVLRFVSWLPFVKYHVSPCMREVITHFFCDKKGKIFSRGYEYLKQYLLNSQQLRMLMCLYLGKCTAVVNSTTQWNYKDSLCSTHLPFFLLLLQPCSLTWNLLGPEDNQAIFPLALRMNRYIFKQEMMFISTLYIPGKTRSL